MASTSVDENEWFEGVIEIDGTDSQRAKIGIANDLESSHNHDITGVSGNTESHTHTDGTYTASNDAGGAVQTDTRTSLMCAGSRIFTPAGSSFNIKLQGNRSSGNPGNWNHGLQWVVMRG
jgi:hypothetical protein